MGYSPDMVAYYRLFFLFIALATMVPPAHAVENSVTFAVGEWAPYISESEADSIVGTIVKEAMSAVGKTVKYDFYPWKRSYTLINEGEAAGSFPWIFTPGRSEEVLFSETIFSADSVLFYTNPQLAGIDYSDVGRLKGLKVGGVVSYWYHDDFKAQGIRVDKSLTVTEAMRKLLEGWVDLVPEDKRAGWALIREHFPDQAHLFRTSAPHPRAISLHAIFPKTAEGRAMRDGFNRGLAIIRANGTFDRIVEELDN